jgi:hypothetical protein
MPMSHDMMMVLQLPYFWCDIMNEDVELKISSLSTNKTKLINIFLPNWQAIGTPNQAQWQ